jgi:hypothetical protein
MKGINERELLPIIRGAVSGDMDKVRIFLEAIASVINNCKQSDKTILEYKGWAFDFQLINRDSEYTWTLDGAEINIVQEKRDDYSIVISDNTSIKVHFHSFLWNM